MTDNSERNIYYYFSTKYIQVIISFGIISIASKFLYKFLYK